MCVRVELSLDDDMFDQRRRKFLLIRVGGSEWDVQENEDEANEEAGEAHDALT